MRATLVFLLLGVLFQTGYPQNRTSILDVRNIYDEKGDYYFDLKEYKKAIVYYNMAHKTDPANYYAVLRRAETYSVMDLLDQAAESYSIVFSTNLYVPNEYRMQYAMLLLRNKDITGFEKQMAAYNRVVHEEIYNYMSSKEVRAKMYRDSMLIMVENEQVLNTPFSEISPSVYDDQLVFASSRKNLSGTSANAYYSLFSANYLNDGHLGRLNHFGPGASANRSETAVAFIPENRKVFVTRSTGAKSGLQTYSGDIPASGQSLTDLKQLTIDGWTAVGQPTFSDKGMTMYFVSEAPGGAGNKDIWVTRQTEGKWGKPENLGSRVNTSKNEIYPFVVGDTMLYFASEGHSGFGGYDLYRVHLKKPEQAAENLGNRVNSSYNEYGLAFTPGGLTGYFCSDRPGGFGKEDIYRLHYLDLKVKLAAYRFKRKSFMEEDKINLYLSDGSEYNIASDGNTGFNFSFLPTEAYKMVIRHENPLAGNILYNTALNDKQKREQFLDPAPFQRTEIRLQQGMKYQFTAGMEPISKAYRNELNSMSGEYQNTGSTIDLTALARELLMNEGEVYTIRFIPDDDVYEESKSKIPSALTINSEEIAVEGRSFFIMLPLDIEANFNIKTDIGYFRETYNPKKVGAVKVDEAPVIREEAEIKPVGFPVLVNTASFDEVAKGREIEAKELTIIPGSMYLLTFGRTGSNLKDEGVFIPLTKGVKYNLGTTPESRAAHQQALTKMAGSQSSSGAENEELIDISLLSKELDIASERNVVFSLTPAPQMAGQSAGGRNVLTTLAVDGRKYFITSVQRLQVNLTLPENEKVNIQTDLTYLKENFDPSTIALSVDTTSVTSDLVAKEKSQITDPVYDVIVVNFNLNDYSVRPDAKSILTEKVVQELKKDSRLYVTIKGYTDPLGDADYNEKLSRNRAQAVKDFLTANGIGENRIRTFSYGETQALQSGKNWEDLTEEELQKHRKVEIVIYLPK